MGVERMNLPEIFKMQKALDDRILQEHELKTAPFNERILAFIVELGECANEWRGFKYWSKDRKPRIEIVDRCNCPHCSCLEEEFDVLNPLLEEFVDKLHFLVSLGLTLKIDPAAIKVSDPKNWQAEDITQQYLLIAGKANALFLYRCRMDWEALFHMLMGLGDLLGFSQDEIFAAYMKKNAINHQRQAANY
jgi:dimeric dUTPase (all-alpha-NTP-PPase superfamily)